MALDLRRLRRDWGDPQREAQACRTSAAVFDFSFVGRARIRGASAAALVRRLTDRPVEDMAPGRIRYALRADGQGRLLSDLTIWKLGPDTYEVMSGRIEDIADLVAEPWAWAEAQDLTEATAIYAVQGPRALAALGGLAETEALRRLGYFEHAAIRIAGIDCQVGRLGYTGEAGFEIIAPKSAGETLWQALAAKATPAGFAAADILRIEAGLVLFANEFQVPVTAAEAGLARFTSGDRGAPPAIMLVCLEARAAEPPVVWQPSSPPPRPDQAGQVAITSACWSARSGGVLALGYARSADLAAGHPLADPTGEFADLVPVGLPFHDPGKRRPRQAW